MPSRRLAPLVRILGVALGLLGLVLAWSAPAPAAGGVATEHLLWSPALDRELRYALYLPEGYPAPGHRYPVLYLLHGFGATPREWLDGIALPPILDTLIGSGAIQPVIVVMPDGAKSWYVDSGDRGGPGNYATAIARDLVAAIDTLHPTLAEPAGRAIAGLSMGGFGALHLAFTRRDRFGQVAALSPAVFAPGGLSWARWSVGDGAAQRQRWFPDVFGRPFDVATYLAEHPFAHLDTLATDPPRILLTSGDDDAFGFEVGTVELFLALRQRGVPVELRIDDGGHDWPYWRFMAPAMLRFLDQGWPSSARP